MIHLRRIDPTRNMARFYAMAVQPTLFGEWALQREWGRIGSAGLASESDAVVAMARVLKAKQRHGYAAS
jgi:predicted DNA-binding WGR domain protein